MLGWLSSVCFENGDIPLFNDAAFGISPSPVALFAYAKRLGLNFEKSGLSDSGYRKLVTNKFECVVDVSRVGPDYQPGHAHADTFTFELHINNRPVIICLLYTSDAADDLLCVDLGGRRIIKKKNTANK